MFQGADLSYSENLRPCEEPSSAASDSMARVAYSSHVLAELAARSVENPPSATRVARSSMSESAKSGGLMDARP